MSMISDCEGISDDASLPVLNELYAAFECKDVARYRAARNVLVKRGFIIIENGAAALLDEDNTETNTKEYQMNGMTGKKPWWQSKTIWLAALAALAQVPRVGETIGVVDPETMSHAVEGVLSVVTVIAGGAAVGTRSTATAVISSDTSPNTPNTTGTTTR